jgi:hypothetical protein
LEKVESEREKRKNETNKKEYKGVKNSLYKSGKT